MTRCKPCEKGETTRHSGSASCDKCDLGRYGDAIGLASCKACPVGLFQDGKGSEKCQPCGQSKIPNAQQTACEQPEWLTEVDCDHVTQYLNDSSSNHMNHTCEPCPLGGSCLGPVGWSGVRAKNGWWRLHNKEKTPPMCLNRNDDDSAGSASEPSCAFAQCLNPIACKGASNPKRYLDSKGVDFGAIDQPEGCNEDLGYVNGYNCSKNKQRCRACGTCKVGYKRHGGVTKCKKCPEQGTNRALLGFGGVVMCIGTAFMVYLTIQEAGDDETTSETIKKILLNFLQLTSLAAALPLQWPASVETTLTAMSTLSSAGTTLLIPGKCCGCGCGCFKLYSISSTHFCAAFSLW